MGRAIYGGIYDSNHPQADEHGFRKSVLQFVEISKLRDSLPGGSFVSPTAGKMELGHEKIVPCGSTWHAVALRQTKSESTNSPTGQAR